MGNLFTELMRRLFGLLDNIVIFLIETLYNLIMMIADTNVLGDLIYHYLGRIYVFLGIFMVFKLSFSMITYIVNPDEFTDKGKGFGKLISNVIISLILLVATPTLFSVAFDIQSDILKTNAIYQIVTGKELPNDIAADNNTKMGKQIAYGIYSTFIYKSEVNNNYDVDLAGDIRALTDSVSAGKCDNTANPYCLVDMDTLLKKAESGKGFANNYWYLVSTICGVFVAYILLTFCFDTAVRSVKLGFLQIIAPIPILSMLDPKKGNDQLMKWVKECGKTFADLFIRLAGLFLVVDIIGVILGTNGDVQGMLSYGVFKDAGAPQTNLFVRLFVIIGLLMFAKQMPQLISDILGIKLSGDGFNLKKKMGGALGGAALVGAGAMAGRALGTGARALGNTGKNALKLGGSGLHALGKTMKGDKAAAAAIMGAATQRFGARMGNVGKESLGRMKSLNKKYSGDTAKSLEANIAEQMKLEKGMSKGKDIYDKMNGLKDQNGNKLTDEAANIAIFGQRYGSSMNALKSAKSAALLAQQNLEIAQQDLQALLNAQSSGSLAGYADEAALAKAITDKRNAINDPSGLSKAVKDAQDKVDTLSKQHEALQKADTHHATMEANLKSYKTTK